MHAIAHLRYVEHAWNTRSLKSSEISRQHDAKLCHGAATPRRVLGYVPRRCDALCRAVLCRQSCMLPLPLLAAQQAQAQLVAWHGIKTVDGSPPPHPLRGYCGTHKEDKTTE